MKVRANLGLWLSNPASALSLNLENGEELFGQVQICGTDMSKHWVRLGTAEVVMNLEESQDSIALGCLEKLREKIAEADAEHEVRRQMMLELVGKLSSLTYSPKD